LDKSEEYKKVKCSFRDCKELVEVPLYSDEIVLCSEHAKKLALLYVSSDRLSREFIKRRGVKNERP